MKPRTFRADLLPKIRDLQIEAKQQVLSAMLSGEWISRLRGKGIEFAGYRQYTSGDDASLIDWKASLRSRKLVIKELQEERNLNVYIFLDVSDTMLFGTVDKFKAEYAAELSSTLSFAALHVGENVSLAMWSNEIKKFLPLGHGVAHHTQIIRMLSEIENYGGTKNVEHAASQLNALMPQPGLIVMVSDCVGFDESWERTFKLLSTKHDFILALVRDPRDRELPEKGEFVMEDPSTGQKLVIDAADYYEPFKKYVQDEEEKIKNILDRAGGELMLFQTTETYKDILTHSFLRRKNRWWHN